MNQERDQKSFFSVSTEQTFESFKGTYCAFVFYCIVVSSVRYLSALYWKHLLLQPAKRRHEFIWNSPTMFISQLYVWHLSPQAYRPICDRNLYCTFTKSGLQHRSVRSRLKSTKLLTTYRISEQHKTIWVESTHSGEVSSPLSPVQIVMQIVWSNPVNCCRSKSTESIMQKKSQSFYWHSTILLNNTK